MWNLIDNTDMDRKKGWFILTKDGQRVADVFPWAAGALCAGPEWTIEAAREIVRKMNKPEQSE